MIFFDFVLGGTGHGGEREKARVLQEDEKESSHIVEGLLMLLRCEKVLVLLLAGVTVREKYGHVFSLNHFFFKTELQIFVTK